jgi:hypothetical protein
MGRLSAEAIDVLRTSTQMIVSSVFLGTISETGKLVPVPLKSSDGTRTRGRKLKQAEVDRPQCSPPQRSPPPPLPLSASLCLSLPLSVSLCLSVYRSVLLSVALCRSVSLCVALFCLDLSSSPCQG